MKTFFVILFAGVALVANSQIISQWNFNSDPSDTLPNTGSFLPVKGNWTFKLIGGLSGTFASANGNGGSSDTLLTDNSCLHTNAYPGQGKASDSCGFMLSGYLNSVTDLDLTLDLRATATASRFYSVSYSLDSGVNWVKAGTVEFVKTASSWQRQVRIAFPDIEAEEVPLWCQLKFCSSFAPNDSAYVAVGATSTYSSSGTVRFDMLTINGESTLPPVDTTAPWVSNLKTVSDREIEIQFNEPVSKTSVLLKSNYVGMGSGFSLSLVGKSGANLSFDEAFLQGVHHSLTIKQVADTAGNPMKTAVFDVFRNDARPPLIVSEVMYNNPGEDDLEFVELHNLSSATINLEAFSMFGVQFEFTSMDKIKPHGYFLLARDSMRFKEFFGQTARQWTSGSLSNAGESLGLLNQKVDTISTVFYDNTNGWPKEPNGMGASLELKRPDPGIAEPGYWRSCFFYIGDLDAVSVYATPGFGYAGNQVSFKTDSIRVFEGLASDLKFQLYQTDNKGVCVSIENIDETAFEYEDYQINGKQFCTDSLVYIWSGLTVLKDRKMEEPEYFSLQIADVENGVAKGFKELVVEVLDGDTLFPKLCFNEWMPQNTNKVPDSKGKFGPWLELANPNQRAIDLSSFFLKIKGDSIDEMIGLGAVTIDPNSYRLIYLFSDSAGTNDHLSISFPSKNAQVSLIGADGLTIIDEFAFQSTLKNRVYGVWPACEDSVQVLEYPTPGKANYETTDLMAIDALQGALYPNPADDVVFVPFADVEYEIFDASGRLLKRITVEHCFSVHELPNGAYWLHCAEKKWGAKFVVNGVRK